MIRNFTALAIACAVTGLAAGCGGDDDEGPSKAEYVEQADAICKQGNAEIEKQAQAQFGDLEGEPTQAQVVSFLTDIAIPSTEDQAEKLRALEPPEGDEETVEKIYDTLDEEIARAKEDPVAVAREEESAGFNEATKLAKDYGLKVCGEG